jgi:hypothetical protein
MEQNIKVVSINNNGRPMANFDKLLSSRDRIKEILKKKLESSNKLQQHTKKNVSFAEEKLQEPRVVEERFMKQFSGFNASKTKKKPIEEKIEKRNKTRKEYFNNQQQNPLIPNKNVLTIFQHVIYKNDIPLTIKFIKTITRNQLILILCSIDIIQKNTKAPTPLLKNILYNFITSGIHIIK